MNTQSGRVSVLGWFSLALLFVILGSVLFWFTFAAVSIPHARLLAKAYAASADCNPSIILQAGALQSQLPASSDAPGRTLCEVVPMTVVSKDISQVKNYTSYSVTLTDEKGKYYNNPARPCLLGDWGRSSDKDEGEGSIGGGEGCVDRERQRDRPDDGSSGNQPS